MIDGAAPDGDMVRVAAAIAGIAVLDHVIAEQRAEVAWRSLAAHHAEQHRDEMWDEDVETGESAAA